MFIGMTDVMEVASATMSNDHAIDITADETAAKAIEAKKAKAQRKKVCITYHIINERMNIMLIFS